MKYCMRCGSSEVSCDVPPTDSSPRHQCLSCGYINYINPKPVVGCIPVYGDQVLLCKRAIEPKRGRWTLPAGYMEVGETAVEAMLRETWEEAGARVKLQSLYVLFSIPHAVQMYIMYRATLLHGHHRPGQESTETRLFPLSSIPWQDIAFSTIRYTLELYVKDIKTKEFPVHTGTIIRTDTGDIMRLDGQEETPLWGKDMCSEQGGNS